MLLFSVTFTVFSEDVSEAPTAWPFMDEDQNYYWQRGPEPEVRDPGYGYRQRGMRALGDGIYDGAARFFTSYRNRAEGQEPDFTDATILLLRTRLMQGELEEARRILEHYDEHSDGTPPDEEYYQLHLRFWRAALLMREERYEEATEKIEPLLEDEIYPELRERAYLLLSEAYKRLGELSAAEERLLEFLEKFPESESRTHVFLKLVRVSVALERFSEAVEYLQEAEEVLGEDEAFVHLHRLHVKVHQGEFEEALESYELIKEDIPDAHEPVWWRVLAEFSRRLLEEEEYENALRVLPRVRRLASRDREKAEMLLAQARAEVELEEFEQGRESLQTFIADFPEHEKYYSARVELAEMLEQAGEHLAAVEHWRVAAESEEADLELRYGSFMKLGKRFMEEEEPESALEIFQQTQELPLAEDKRARVLAGAGEAAMAAAAYDQAAEYYGELADKLPETQDGPLARLLQGQAFADNREPEKAAASYRRFVEDYPEHEQAAEAWMSLAETLRESGEVDKSMEALYELAEQFPEDDLAPYSLMEIYQTSRCQGDLERSLETLNRLTADYPDSQLYPKARYHQIYVSFQAGDADSAITESERFLEEFEEDILAADVLLWLADHYDNREQTSSALEKYERVVEDFPETEQALTALFEAAYLHHYRRQEYQESLDRLVELEEQKAAMDEEFQEISARAAFLHGDGLAELGQYEEAAEWFEQAAEKAAESDRRKAARGRVADMRFAVDSEEGAEEAASIYKELLEEEDEMSSSLRENLSYRLGRTLRHLERHEEALDVYLDIVYSYDIEARKGAVRDWYYFARAAHEAAEILISQGRRESAANIYERIGHSRIPTSEEAFERARELRNQDSQENAEE